MKKYQGDLWMETQDDGRVRLGFRKQFIDDRCGECFHVMQADVKFVKKGGPLVVLESNDGLTPIKSPVGGTILYFNTKARNFPDRLMEEDILLEILPEGVKLKQEEVTKKVKTKVVDDVEWAPDPGIQAIGAGQQAIGNWGLAQELDNQLRERERVRVQQELIQRALNNLRDQGLRHQPAPNELGEARPAPRGNGRRPR